MLGADQLLGLAFSGKRHQHGTRPRGKDVEHGVIAGLADRDMTALQKAREISAEALDRQAGGRHPLRGGEFGLGETGTGKNAPGTIGETALAAGF